MTFTIKHTRSDRPVVAEYRCPKHGLFSLEVARDENGDPPVEMPCPAREGQLVPASQFLSLSVAERVRASLGNACGVTAPYTVSAPRVGVRRVEAVKGKWEKPEKRTFLDTRNLGEGQDLDDFRADRERIWDEKRKQDLKELLRD